MKLGKVVPPTLVVSLDALNPVEESRDPLELLVFLAGADCLGVGAEINVGVSSLSTFVCRSLAEVVIEFSEVTVTFKEDQEKGK